MQRFKNILLVCDNDSIHDALVEKAIWLAAKNSARITLLDIMDAPASELARFFSALPGRGNATLEHELKEHHRHRLGLLAEKFRAAGIETQQIILEGIGFIEIIKRVLTHNHDLVMKGVSAAVSDSLFFASSDMHLLRKCPCPVLLMKKARRRQHARVLAAVDPDPGEWQRDALNTLIMDLATSLSEADDSELHVVNAWEFAAESTLRHSGFARIPGEEVDRLSRAERKRKKANLDLLLEGYAIADRKRQVHLLKGEARKIIPEFARRKRAELIVMGTVGRTGVQGFFIGNTAEEILSQVECSVLAVKPPGFESPVKADTPANTDMTVPAP
ncbi:MAG: universal stress protein E [Paracoccaceae bacterium]|jgi:universal stress protein E